MDIKALLSQVLAHAERFDYAGYDPYDALNSPFLRALTGTSKWARIAVTQTMRRLPVNLRPLAGIARGHNPKGVGLFLWGCAKLFCTTGDARYLAKIDHLLQLLHELRCQGYSGNCWGYNFDWQSGTYFRPKGTPTIVNSAFIGHALLDCYEHTENERALEMAQSIGDFILNDLHRTPLGDAFCFSYTPVDQGVVHNANLLGASILVRLARYADSPHLIDPAMSSLAYTMKHQHASGAWFYADTRRQKWIDSFHTGFNLQAIRYILEEGYASEYRDHYLKGVHFYADNFFLPDGTPKYYNNRVYPIDIHAPAQAIAFFSGMGAEYQSLTERILDWMLRNMLGANALFFFRKGKYLTNRVPYMRWSQAWAFHAVTEYALQRSAVSEPPCPARRSHRISA